MARIKLTPRAESPVLSGAQGERRGHPPPRPTHSHSQVNGENKSETRAPRVWAARRTGPRASEELVVSDGAGSGSDGAAEAEAAQVDLSVTQVEPELTVSTDSPTPHVTHATDEHARAHGNAAESASERHVREEMESLRAAIDAAMRGVLPLLQSMSERLADIAEVVRSNTAQRGCACQCKCARAATKSATSADHVTSVDVAPDVVEASPLLVQATESAPLHTLHDAPSKTPAGVLSSGASALGLPAQTTSEARKRKLEKRDSAADRSPVGKETDTRARATRDHSPEREANKRARMTDDRSSRARTTDASTAARKRKLAERRDSTSDDNHTAVRSPVREKDKRARAETHSPSKPPSKPRAVPAQNGNGRPSRASQSDSDDALTPKRRRRRFTPSPSPSPSRSSSPASSRSSSPAPRQTAPPARAPLVVAPRRVSLRESLRFTEHSILGAPIDYLASYASLADVCMFRKALDTIPSPKRSSVEIVSRLPPNHTDPTCVRFDLRGLTSRGGIDTSLVPAEGGLSVDGEVWSAQYVEHYEQAIERASNITAVYANLERRLKEMDPDGQSLRVLRLPLDVDVYTPPRGLAVADVLSLFGRWWPMSDPLIRRVAEDVDKEMREHFNVRVTLRADLSVCDLDKFAVKEGEIAVLGIERDAAEQPLERRWILLTNLDGSRPCPYFAPSSDKVPRWLRPSRVRERGWSRLERLDPLKSNSYDESLFACLAGVCDVVMSAEGAVRRRRPSLLSREDFMDAYIRTPSYISGAL